MATALKLMSAEHIQGARVLNAQGADLGKIDDVLIDTFAGQVVYAILSHGGIIGIGHKLFAVPWDVLAYSAEHDAYLLDIAEEKLKNAPGFDAANPQDMADPRWAKPVHDYYGSKASWYLPTGVA
jgi:sporulation protein YlmC with PRC-barrel domain